MIPYGTIVMHVATKRRGVVVEAPPSTMPERVTVQYRGFVEGLPNQPESSLFILRPVRGKEPKKKKVKEPKMPKQPLTEQEKDIRDLKNNIEAVKISLQLAADTPLPSEVEGHEMGGADWSQKVHNKLVSKGLLPPDKPRTSTNSTFPGKMERLGLIEKCPEGGYRVTGKTLDEVLGLLPPVPVVPVGPTLLLDNVMSFAAAAAN